LFLKCISDFFKGILTLENWNDNKKAKKLREIITNSLLNAVDIGYKSPLTPEGGTKKGIDIAYNAKDLELLKRINDNIYTFAAYKNYQTIKELGNYLKDSNGDIRSFADFRKAVLQDVHAKYNLQWLEAEYNTTYAQAQNASRWTDFESNKDLFPMLKYNTQRDANVRDGHKVLQGIVAPIDDEIWDRISPVRAWQCRCYLTSHQASEVTVTRDLPDIPKLPKNSPFSGGNVGKTGVVFGEQHPYFNVSGEEKARIKSVIEKENPTTIHSKDRLQKTLSQIENKIKDETKEHGYAVNQNGEVLFSKVGSTEKVEMTEKEKSLLKNCIFTHNHPDKISFLSTGDIGFCVEYDLYQIRAVVGDVVHILTRPKTGWTEDFIKKYGILFQKLYFDNEDKYEEQGIITFEESFEFKKNGIVKELIKKLKLNFQTQKL
jgi:hypothetical protein